MTNFKKSDLQSKHYDWTASKEYDDAKITGFPDNVELARNEGYEVLPFINRYMADRGWVQLNSFHKIESAIKDKLPGLLRSHSHVKEWLDKNV